MTKMHLTTDFAGTVTLAYDDEGERVIREFTCPVNGGYVREWRGGDAKQVCQKLYSQGNTLTAASRAHLPAVIRREYSAMRAAEKRTAAQF